MPPRMEPTDDDRWLERLIAAQQAVIDRLASEGIVITRDEFDEIFARDKTPPEIPDFSGSDFDEAQSGH